jgi:hypothetical protein
MHVNHVIASFITQDAPNIVRQIPEITITEGRASINEPQPHIIIDETGKPAIIIDTTGQYKTLQGTKAFMLLKQTELNIRMDETIKVFDLSAIDNLRIDQMRIYRWMATVNNTAMFILYPFTLLFSFLFFAVQAIAFAAIGMIYNRKLNIALSFQALIRLSVIALTPAVILETIFLIIRSGVPFWWLLNPVITMVYLFFGIKSASEGAVSDGESR